MVTMVAPKPCCEQAFVERDRVESARYPTPRDAELAISAANEKLEVHLATHRAAPTTERRHTARPCALCAEAGSKMGTVSDTEARRWSRIYHAHDDELEKQERAARWQAAGAEMKKEDAERKARMEARRLANTCAICQRQGSRTRPIIDDLPYGDRVHLSCARHRSDAAARAAGTLAPEVPSGTCQVCFNQQKTHGRLLVLHGYKRPGTGWIEGRCWGVEFPPFEVSCERTKAFVEQLHRIRVDEEEVLVYHKKGADYYYHHPQKGYRVKEPEPIKVERGTAAVGYKYGHDYVPSYEELRAAAIHESESKLNQIRSDIRIYEEKVASWKPVPWPTGVA